MKPLNTELSGTSDKASPGDDAHRNREPRAPVAAGDEMAALFAPADTDDATNPHLLHLERIARHGR